MGKYETKNSSSVVRSFGAASAEMFQPEVNAAVIKFDDGTSGFKNLLGFVLRCAI